jgi:hypothetical protein
MSKAFKEVQMGKKGQKLVDKHLQEITKMVEAAKAKDALYELNEYLRQLVMGSYGDTHFDLRDIERLHRDNSTWKKKPYRKKSKKG